MRSYTPLLVGALFTSLAGCEIAKSNAITEDSDALNVEMQSAAEPNDTANSIYFRARPAEQGFLVRRVNRLVTTCSDGQARLECPVADIDTAQLQLDPQRAAELRSGVNDFLLRGTLAGQSLRATEAWRGHPGRNATGAYVRATNSGIVCITYPCMSYNAARLNSDQPPTSVAAVKFEGFENGGGDALAQLSSPQGVLVAAEASTVSGPAGTAAALTATEYYLPFGTTSSANASSSTACGGRGLPPCATGLFCKFAAGADCGRADQPGVCAVPPQLCTDEYNPVCGCNGQTYSNACRAAAASTSVDYSGECRS